MKKPPRKLVQFIVCHLDIVMFPPPGMKIWEQLLKLFIKDMFKPYVLRRYRFMRMENPTDNKEKAGYISWLKK